VSISLGCLALAVPAQAQPTVTAEDGNDVADRLDLRSATLSPESHDRARVTLIFWNPVPPWLLARHSIRLELGTSDDPPDDGEYRQAFLRNGRGSVRMVWGEAGSNCCGTVAARHPNRFTYTGVLPYSIYGTVPPPTWLRGFSTRRLDCQGRQQLCALFEGRAADRTRWVGI
jgi:hypothetical protein